MVTSEVIKIGQNDVFLVLKKNPNQYFAAEDLKQMLGMNVQSIYSCLRKLADKGDLKFKEIHPPTGPKRKIYAFIDRDEQFEKVVSEYRKLRGQERYGFFNSDVLATLMLIKEIRENKK